MPPPFRRRLRGPKLSVVIPVYNVEGYLAECLDSVVAQEFTDFDVVVVDDGSTDGSAAIASQYAERHRNISVISTENRGMSAARNLGIRHCSGEYLGFADGDDIVPAHAFGLMVSTLEESHSDFVVGSLKRLAAGQLTEPLWLRRVHAQRRLGITVDELPQILPNVFPVTKVFRRSFWDDIGLRFPEGVRYEDQVAMTEAYLRAESLDVIRRPVYNWRVRMDGSSVTQRRHELADLQDRIATKKMTSNIVADLASPAVRNYWAHNGLGGDLPLYFREVPRAGENYWRLLVTGVRELYTNQPPIWESQLLRVPQRLVGWLVVQDRRAEAETVLRWLQDHPGPLPLRTEGSHVVAELPFHDDQSSGIPREMFWLADHELEFDARLVAAGWHGSRLDIDGLAVIRGAPTTGVPCSIEARLRSSTGELLTLPVVARESPQATEWVKRLPQRYDKGGFTASIDVAALPPPAAPAVHDASGPPVTWVVELSVAVADIHRSGRIRSKPPGLELLSADRPEKRVSLSFEVSSGLVITVSPPPS